MKENENKPSFEWASDEDFKFSESTKVETKGLEKNEDLKNLESFSIFTQFKLDKMIQKDGAVLPSLIFGHSDQSCWQLIVTESGMEFGRQDDLKKLGYNVVKDKVVHMGLIYNKNEKTLKAYYKTADNKMVQENDVTFTFECSG